MSNIDFNYVENLTRSIFFIVLVLFFAVSIVSLIWVRNGKEKAAKRNNILNGVCTLASALGIAGSINYLFGVNFSNAQLELLHIKTSLPLISIDLTIDSLSAFFILGLSILTFCVSIYSMGYMKHYNGKRNVALFNFFYSTFIISMYLVFTASSAITFFMTWEVMSVLSYFLVVFEHEKEEAGRAGTLYIIMTHIGAGFLMIAFIFIYIHTGCMDIFIKNGGAEIPSAIRNVIFGCLLIGFGTKAGIIPLNIWLPKAHPAAPSNVSALMSGIMIKTAIYGLVRFIFSFLGIEVIWWGMVIMILGIFSSVLGVTYALMENNVKKLLAYSSIENVGIIFLGMGVSAIAFAMGNVFVGSIAMLGFLLHSFNHVLFKGGLFMGAGAIQYATGTKNIEKLGGLIKTMPQTAICMLCFSMSICAIVPFNGFVGEWLTYQSMFLSLSQGIARINAISIIGVSALALSGALASVCFVKLFGIGFLGKPRTEEALKAVEVPMPMRFGMAILATLCLLVGVFPMIIIKPMASIIFDISGFNILSELKGGLFLAYCSMNLENSQISSMFVLVIIIIAIILTIGFAYLKNNKPVQVSYSTWDCGFGGLNERMQYSSTGFVNPLKIVFKALYRPKIVIKVEEGETQYFPVSTEYKVTTEAIIEKYLYSPLITKVHKLSMRARQSIQTGSTHLYMLYVLLALLALLFYNRLV